ncbi:myb-like protein X, partial [Argonauta hians]
VSLSTKLFEELSVNLANINDQFKQLQNCIYSEQNNTKPEELNEVKTAGDDMRKSYLKHVYNPKKPVTFDPSAPTRNIDSMDGIDYSIDYANQVVVAEESLGSSSDDDDDDSYNNLIQLLRRNQNASAEGKEISGNSPPPPPPPPAPPLLPQCNDPKTDVTLFDARSGDCGGPDSRYLQRIIADLCDVIDDSSVPPPPLPPQEPGVSKNSEWPSPVSHANAILQSRRSTVKWNKISSAKSVLWQHSSYNVSNPYFEVPKVSCSNYSSQYIPAKELLIEFRKPSANTGTVSVTDWLTEQRIRPQPDKVDQGEITNITKLYTVDLPPQNNSLNISSSGINMYDSPVFNNRNNIASNIGPNIAANNALNMASNIGNNTANNALSMASNIGNNTANNALNIASNIGNNALNMASNIGTNIGNIGANNTINMSSKIGNIGAKTMGNNTSNFGANVSAITTNIGPSIRPSSIGVNAGDFGAKIGASSNIASKIGPIGASSNIASKIGPIGTSSIGAHIDCISANISPTIGASVGSNMYRSHIASLYESQPLRPLLIPKSEAPQLKLDSNNQISIERPLTFGLA